LTLLSAAVPAWSAEEDLATWKELIARQEVVVKQLQEFQRTYKAAKTPAEQQKIAQEFEAVRAELVTKIGPAISELAPKVFAANPKQFDAGEAALEMAFQANRYEDVLALAAKLTAEGYQSVLVSNMQGIAQFATHDFAGALKTFEAAEAAGELHPQLGGRFMPECAEYLKLWEVEQGQRKKDAALKGDQQLPLAKFVTAKGEIEIELFEDQAPNTVANFISLIEAKTYDGVKFHRVIPTFMAQGGDPLSKNDNPRDDGTGGPGYTIDCECYRPDARKHFRGTLSMAHAGKDTGGSQFFITHLPTAHLNPSAEEERGHTVFGRVTKGLDVAAALEVGDEIEAATVIRKRKHPYAPKTKPE
jgi:cyclophilin family peptidyl-prolyl cis-trans isomerase